MSVLIFDENNIISIPVSSERYFNSVWEEAIRVLHLNHIGNGKYIYYADLDQIIDEFEKVQAWAQIHLKDIKQEYVIDHVENILEQLPKQWNRNQHIQRLWMG